jgi:ABC-type glycerol-3-phosphate transport system permease component
LVDLEVSLKMESAEVSTQESANATRTRRGALYVAGRLTRASALYLVLVVVSLVWILPYVWMARTSFSSGVNIFSTTLELLPREVTLHNFSEVFRLVPIAKLGWNTVVITFGTTFLVIASSALAGYALSRPGLPFATTIMVFFLAALMVPGESILIPTFLSVKYLGLLNSHLGVILPMASDAFVIFVFERFFSQLPIEVNDAATVDGASDFQIFWQIVVPMSAPVFAAMTTLVFIGAYDSFLWPLVVLNRPDMMPLTLGLFYFETEQIKNYEYVITYSLLLTLPILAVFLSAQKFFIKGLQLGAVKG